MAIIELAGIRAVVFDLDDTLYPERSYAFSGFDAVAGWLQKRYSCGFEPAGRMRELFDTVHRPRVFNQILSELGIDPTPELVQGMVGIYRTHRPRISLFQDAEEALARWSGRFRLGMISDGPLVSQQSKVQALRLADRLDRIILTDSWGPAFWKPHCRAFEDIEEAWGWRESACIYIGDNAGKDLVAPRKMGWRTVQIRRPDAVHADAVPPLDGEPEFRVASLTDIILSS